MMRTRPKAHKGVTEKDAIRAEKQSQALERGKGISFFARQVAREMVRPSKRKSGKIAK